MKIHQRTEKNEPGSRLAINFRCSFNIFNILLVKVRFNRFIILDLKLD